MAHRHFHAPTALPVIGALVSIALMTTKDADAFARAGLLLALGVVLWAITWSLPGRHQPPLDTGVLEAVERPAG